jgi:hypothetical protein
MKRADHVSASTVWRRSPFDISVIVGCAALSLVVMAFTDESNVPDTATATLAAAIIGIADTSLGHTSGHHHGSYPASVGSGSKKRILIVVILLGAMIGATLLVFIAVPQRSAVSNEGATALCATLLGIAGTVFANETLLRSSVHVRVGWALLAAAVIGGGLAVVSHPFGLSADSFAALACAGVAVAGTLLGHEKGWLLAKSKSKDAVPSAVPSGN